MVKQGADGRAAKRARAAESERRARMFVHAHLAWLEGFPEATSEGLRWHRLDGSAPFVVDGALVARARRAQRTLVSDHGDALATMVGDVARWGAAVDGALAAIVRALRAGGAPVPPVEVLPPRARRQAAAVARAYPDLAAVVDAAVMAMLARPADLVDTLAWLEARGAALARLTRAEPGPRGVLACFRLARFTAEAGADAVAPLLALACADLPLPGPALEAARTTARRLRSSHAATLVLPRTTTATIVDWIGRLATVDPAARARVLAVLAVVDLVTPLGSVQAWWMRTLPQLRRALGATESESLDLRYLRTNLDTVDALIKECPPFVDLVDALAAVEHAAAPGFARCLPPLLRLLAQVPASGNALARFRLLDELRDDASIAGEERMAWLWDALAAELAQGGVSPARLLAPWRAAMEGRGGCFGQPIRNAVGSKAGAKRVAAILVHCAFLAELDYGLVDRAMAFVPTTLAPALVAEVIAAASHVHGYLDADQVRAAVALGGETAADLVAALEQIKALCDELPGRAAGELASLAEHARAGGATWVLRRVLDEKRGRLLVEAAATAAVVPRKRWPALVQDPRGHRWLDGYPAELRGALTRLASADPEAAQTARRILRRDLPHPDDAADELSALRTGRHRSASAGGRLRRLERGSRAPGAVRLARLADRIERVAAQIAIDRFGAAVTAAATATIAQGCGLPAWPGWPLDRQRLAALTALTKLSPRPRELAMRLLRQRAGERPWDLRDDPRNLAFCLGLARRGIDVIPWVDDPPRQVRAADGTTLTVGFADDPLDVFVMGEHFNTCLAADGVNFFSVVTNAADINKRVLYARRADGKVAGRCLFALTDGGRILTFEPYAHESRIEFERIVRDHALALAARMKTEVVGSGTVSTLVADEWYDDGARDLVERFPALGADSALRKELATIDPAALGARLVEALAHPLDDVTLPLVIGMPEVHRRPELVVALGPALLAASAIPDATMIQAAGLALRGGDLALTDRLLAGRVRPRMMVDAPRWIGDLLARVRPSLALSLLRSTRERGVRGWQDEPVERVVVAAMAMETLRRPRQAAALYRVAIRRGWRALILELKPRLAAIEARSA